MKSAACGAASTAAASVSVSGGHQSHRPGSGGAAARPSTSAPVAAATAAASRLHGSSLRRGRASDRVSVCFTKTGLLGIEWEAEVVLQPPDAAAEVLSGLRATLAPASAQGATTTARAASVSKGDLHPIAALVAQRGGARTPPPAGLEAFTPSGSFVGARPGYQFQLGDLGLGYYWHGGGTVEASDVSQVQTGGDMSESDEDDELEYGCRVANVRPSSIAAKALAQCLQGSAMALNGSAANDSPSIGLTLRAVRVCLPFVRSPHSAVRSHVD